MHERGGTTSVNLDVDQSRNISLVPGLTYEINCNREGGFGGATTVWFRNGVAVTVRTGQTVDPSVSSIHANMVDGNNWGLILQRFMDGGRYTCRGANGELTLVIGMSTLIELL